MISKRVTILATFIALFFAGSAWAQTAVTVRDLNKIPDANLTELNQKGADLTDAEVASLIMPEITGDQVQITVVVLSDPYDSGLSSFDDTRGGPNRINVFVRDIAAATDGVEGMGMQITDADYENTGLLNVLVGDVIRVTGSLGYFGTTSQFVPESIEPLGSYQDNGLPDSILDPVLIDGTDALNTNVGEFTNQANWDNYSDLINQYVRIENATILRRTLAETGRPNWNLSTDGGTTFTQNDDLSLRYRNDRIGVYQNPPWNTRDAGDAFEPPAPGSLVNVEGFVVFRGAFEAFEFVGAPAGTFMQISPFTDDDLEILAEPTITNVTVEGPDFVPGSDPVTVTVTVEAADPTDIANVAVVYTTSTGNVVSVATTPQGDGSYTADIPSEGDGVFVAYIAVAEDINGAAFESTSGSYRILNDGINSIEDIQQPASPEESGENGSPFEGITTPMNLTATVQTVGVLGSGVATVQDDPELGPWSGLSVVIPEGTNVAPGDVIEITEATIGEQFGVVTQLNDVTMSVMSTGGTPYAYLTVPTTALQDEAVAQAHQGMLLRFENVTITQSDAGFGEWAFSSDGTSDNEVLADDVSPDISSDFNTTTFMDGDVVDVIQGIWWFSFGDYKLAPGVPGDISTDIEEGELPGTFALDQNYPNPFNPATTIQYTLGAASDVKLTVFDVLGREVATLVEGTQPTGAYNVTFEAANLPSGLYLYRLETATHSFTRSMLLLK